MEIEIKSSLLNSKDFEFVKKSLINVSQADGEDKFRVKTVEYINYTCYNNDDMFFYDMLIFLRFLNPSDEAVAYTTPNKEIFMNCPGHKDIGQKIRQWEFVYDHECLHQLWETFAVEDKIKKEKGSCDHYILNIASDCVINDYLLYYRKKERPSFGIFPDKLKEDTGVEYDRKNDTQYSLYLKLLEVKDKLKKNKDYQDAQPQSGEGGGSGEGQSGEDQSQNNGSGSGGGQSDDNNGSNSSSNGGQNQKNANSAEDAQEQAKQAQEAANRAKKAAEKAEANGDEDYDEKKELADKAQQAADKAKEAADKAKEAAENKDKEGEKKAAQEAKEAADEAKKAADEAEGKKNNNQEGNGADEGDSSGKGEAGKGHEDVTETEADLKKIKEEAQSIIDKYKNKISGSFGDFIKKCKVSKDLIDTGLAVNTKSGSNGWNQKMNSYVNTFVKKKVFQKKREYQETYSRIRRGSGFVEYGKPIKPGKKVKEEKLNINVAFYIDRSGSMSGCIKQVFKACYVISEALKKKFKKESVVDKIEFKLYAFDDSMIEIKYGNQCDARGGTMGFHQILEFMNKNTEDFLINVIITDAQFEINEGEVKKFMKNIKGMLLFITNEDNPTMKKVSKEYETQLFYILADSNFEIK